MLVTMGGFEWRHRSLAPLRLAEDFAFVIPGAAEKPRSEGNLSLLPHRSGFHHADLVAAADVVVGKLGYSTVAEAYHAGSAFLYVQRPRFPESPHLARFVEAELRASEITAAEFRRHGWTDRLPGLLARQRPTAPRANGARAVAEAIARILGLGSPPAS